MPATIDLEVTGLRETQRSLEKAVANLHGAPVLEAFRDATLMVQRDAKIAAPVDTGRLRASITPEVTLEGPDVIGIVGSNVVYAPFQELGTKHIKPKRFLQGAFDKNEERIVKRIERGIEEAIE